MLEGKYEDDGRVDTTSFLLQGQSYTHQEIASKAQEDQDLALLEEMQAQERSESVVASSSDIVEVALLPPKPDGDPLFTVIYELTNEALNIDPYVDDAEDDPLFAEALESCGALQIQIGVILGFTSHELYKRVYALLDVCMSLPVQKRVIALKIGSRAIVMF